MHYQIVNQGERGDRWAREPDADAVVWLSKTNGNINVMMENNEGGRVKLVTLKSNGFLFRNPSLQGFNQVVCNRDTGKIRVSVKPTVASR